MELLFNLLTRKKDLFHFSLQVILGELFGLGVGFQEWKISVTKNTVACSILVAPSVQRGGESLPWQDFGLEREHSFAREMEGRKYLLVIVIFDNSVYVFDLINIPCIRNIIIIFFQMSCSTLKQSFHSRVTIGKPFVQVKRDQVKLLVEYTSCLCFSPSQDIPPQQNLDHYLPTVDTVRDGSETVLQTFFYSNCQGITSLGFLHTVCAH